MDYVILKIYSDINGKEVSNIQMAEDIGKWIRGEENSGTMDILYEDL